MSARTILVVDDDPDMLELVGDALRTEGYAVQTAASAPEALSRIGPHLDLLILDVLLPGPSGYDLCQAVRDAVSCPILFLSARTGEEDRVRGLAAGGDDYLAKPFGVRELRARVHAHLRREERARPAGGRRALRFGALAIDVRARAVTAGSAEVSLTRREFDILALLALHPGQVFTKEQIYEAVWGLEAGGDAATVTEHIKRIRGKIAGVDPERPYIVTLWGVGYRWGVAR